MSITLIGAPAVTISTLEVTAAPVFEYTAGEALSAKEAVCVGESDAKVYKTKADSSTTMPCIGVTKTAATINGTVEVYQGGKVTSINREADFSHDDKIFVSPDTAGKVTKTPPETTGNLVQSLGRAINATDIVLEIDHTVLEIV